MGTAMALMVVLQSEMAAFEWNAEPHDVPGFKSPVQLPDGRLLSAGSVPLESGGRAIHCFHSDDLGKTWTFLSEITRDPTPAVDLGDGTFLRRRNGDLLYVYRHNLTSYAIPQLPERDHRYAVEVALSLDDGATWRPHSTVKAYTGTKMGLWSPALFERSDGVLQCYHDDEHLAEQQGLSRHQWAVMWTWDPAAGQWIDPVVVSRAHDPAHLSRDGMCSVVELPSGRLLCALESVQTTPPHRGCTRLVHSDDGGKTWSWQQVERRMLYAPEDSTYNALSPWMIRLSNGLLMTVFLSDEDRAEPGVCAIDRTDLDVRYVISRDDGVTWERPISTLSPVAYQHSSSWRYTIEDPGPGWEAPGFDDTAWAEGVGGFGMPGTPGQFIGTIWSTSSIWLRRTFRIERSLPAHPRLRVYHNEDAEVYINGVPALRLPGYSDEYRYYLLDPAARTALRTGDNVLAVRCRQTVGGQYIDVALHDLQYIIDDGHQLWWPGVCEVRASGGGLAVLVQYPQRPSRQGKAKLGVLAIPEE